MADSTRREFVKQAALGTVALAAFSPARVLGANDRVRVGMIGVGGRGQELLKQVQQVPNAQLVAIADIYSLHREQAKQMAPGIDVLDDHRRLLERKDIDAVINRHPACTCIQSILWRRLQAGKDLYSEKTMTW